MFDLLNPSNTNETLYLSRFRPFTPASSIIYAPVLHNCLFISSSGLISRCLVNCALHFVSQLSLIGWSNSFLYLHIPKVCARATANSHKPSHALSVDQGYSFSIFHLLHNLLSFRETSQHDPLVKFARIHQDASRHKTQAFPCCTDCYSKSRSPKVTLSTPNLSVAHQ